MSNNSMVRYSANALAQGSASEYRVQNMEGEAFSAYYPPINPYADFTEFVATSSRYGMGDKHNVYYACPSKAGYYGILVTCKNACKNAATMAKCSYGADCLFYHAPPGSIMTSLPKCNPVSIGKIDTAVGNSKKFSSLTAWRPEDQLSIIPQDEPFHKNPMAKYEDRTGTH